LNFQFSICICAALLASTGCGSKADVSATVSELEKAFPAAATTTAAPAQPDQPIASQPPVAEAYVALALSAVRTNDYVAGVIALQTVQRLTNVSAPQRMAAERARQAIVADLVGRAGSGDAKAKADLAAIERTLSQ